MQNGLASCFELGTCCQSPTFDIGSDRFICRSEQKLGKLSNISIVTGDISRNKVLMVVKDRDNGFT